MGKVKVHNQKGDVTVPFSYQFPMGKVKQELLLGI